MTDTDIDLFAHAAPASVHRKHPGFATRRPSLYLLVSRTDDRATCCSAARQAIREGGSFTRFFEVLRARRDRTDDRAERARLERLVEVLDLAPVHDITGFLGRVRRAGAMNVSRPDSAPAPSSRGDI